MSPANSVNMNTLSTASAALSSTERTCARSSSMSKIDTLGKRRASCASERAAPGAKYALVR